MSDTKWWQKAVVYQIYPRSFQDSNNDGIGDLRGIIDHLPYLHKLGVDVLWLNPIYKTTNVDNGYDISDYKAINPDFGSMNDFNELLNKVHALGMKLMMDLVVNHSSSDNKWFKQSRQGKKNAYRDYYIWRDPVDGHEPNNWGSYFGGPAWTFDQSSGQYYLHLFAVEQPDLNWENTNLRHSVYEMMNWWADKGVDGFRMDVINLISKPAGLPNGPKDDQALYSDVEPLVSDGPKVDIYLKEMNQAVMSKHDMITVGETVNVKTKNARQYANLDGSELNMVFQFEHMLLDGNPNPLIGKWYDSKTKLSDLRNSLTKWQTALAGKAWNSLYWNNHDQPRVVSRFGDDSPQYRVKSAKMLATILHMLQGTPYVYEGEEIGMTNVLFNLEDYQDIETKNIFDQLVNQEKLVDKKTMLTYIRAHSRDNARTPMQWSNTHNAGFSSHKPWLKVNPNYVDINVADALKDPNSLFYYYQKLIDLRHKLPVVTDGRYALIEGNDKDPDVFAYVREDEREKLIVIANYSNKNVRREYDIPAKAQLILKNYPDDQGHNIRPYESKVYLFDKTK